MNSLLPEGLDDLISTLQSVSPLPSDSITPVGDVIDVLSHPGSQEPPRETIPSLPPTESDEELKTRFQVELEFVLCLANPNYLNFLAQRDYFKKQTFVNYLKYLLYWKRPEYAKYLKYPQCLHFLELLQEEKFRDALNNLQNAKFIEDQQILQWQYYVRKRMRLQNIPPGDCQAESPEGIESQPGPSS